MIADNKIKQGLENPEKGYQSIENNISTEIIKTEHKNSVYDIESKLNSYLTTCRYWPYEE